MRRRSAVPRELFQAIARFAQLARDVVEPADCLLRLPLRLFMRRSSGAGILTILLIAGAIASVPEAIIAARGQTEVKSDPQSTSPAKKEQPKKSTPSHARATGNPLWTIQFKKLVATRERPLFSPTRRPPKPPAVRLPASPPAVPVEPDRPPLVLIGTVVGENEAIGVFRDQSTKRTIRLRRGEHQYGWVLGRLNKRDAVLQQGNATVFLALSADSVPPVTIAAQEQEPRLVRRQR